LDKRGFKIKRPYLDLTTNRKKATRMQETSQRGRKTRQRREVPTNSERNMNPSFISVKKSTKNHKARGDTKKRKNSNENDSGQVYPSQGGEVERIII